MSQEEILQPILNINFSFKFRFIFVYEPRKLIFRGFFMNKF